MTENFEEQPTRIIMRFNIECTLESPNHIGGANDPISSADNPVAVVGGKLCIPGPTLKGAYRSQVESWLNGTFYRDGRWKNDLLRPCLPASRPSRDERQVAQLGKYKTRSCRYQDNPGNQNNQDNRNNLCPACYVLGAMGLVGFVSVPFLFSDAPRGELYSSRLDRVTKTVAQGSNRPYQLAPQDSVFRGVVEVLVSDSLIGWEFGRPRPLANQQADAWLGIHAKMDQDSLIKAFVTDRLSAISAIGGYRSKGFGQVSIRVTPV